MLLDCLLWRTAAQASGNFLDLGLGPEGRALLAAAQPQPRAPPQVQPVSQRPERHPCRVPRRGPFKGRGCVAGPPPPRSAGRPLKGPRPRHPPSASRAEGARSGCGPAGGEGAEGAGALRPLRTMYTITKGPSKLVAQRRTGAQRGWARSHAAAGGEQARRAPEMPASRAADPAAPTGSAAGTLAPVEGWASCHWPGQPTNALGPAGRDGPSGHLDMECPSGRAPAARAISTFLPPPGPRLVFNRVNGRRPPATSPSLKGTQETYTLAHEENVRFVSEAWQQVEQQLGGGPAGESGPRPVQYVERTPNPRLQTGEVGVQTPSAVTHQSPPRRAVTCQAPTQKRDHVPCRRDGGSGAVARRPLLGAHCVPCVGRGGRGGKRERRRHGPR
ncbi:hypothetical protein J1605_005987 [Eschrichtius robustus]|uniref:Protein FAM195A n=1 Tax=Eschrichtius robustus TaxID=9764 RepID=A0AB34H2H8_ESCRO|nr:hypothetical protein J1605_005987 [Eschrichtius robustus]